LNDLEERCYPFFMKRALVALTFIAATSSVAFAEDTVKIKKGELTVGSGKSAVKITKGNLEATADDEGDEEGNVVESEGGSLNIEGVNKKLTHACDDEHAKVINVSGTGHAITLTGECDVINVNGANNKVILDAASVLNVSGKDNQVSYKRGLKGAKAPHVNTSGLRNLVKKLEEKK
jgi:hypothetical protein